MQVRFLWTVAESPKWCWKMLHTTHTKNPFLTCPLKRRYLGCVVNFTEEKNTSFAYAPFHSLNYFYQKFQVLGTIRPRAFVGMHENTTDSKPCVSSSWNPYQMHPLKNVFHLYNGHVCGGRQAYTRILSEGHREWCKDLAACMSAKWWHFSEQKLWVLPFHFFKDTKLFVCQSTG